MSFIVLSYLKRFRWSRPTLLQNHIEITWETPTDVPIGVYRITHFGYFKPSNQEYPRPYQGTSALFQVIA